MPNSGKDGGARTATPDPVRDNDAVAPGRGSFAAALQVAIRTRGLSLERLHSRLLERGLRVSMATLSNWQRGKCRPEGADSIRALHGLEEILGLPSDALVVLLGPPRPRGRWARNVPGAMTFRDVSPVAASIDRMLDEIGRPAADKLRWRTVDELFTVGPDRGERSIRTRVVFEAVADGVDRHIVMYYNEKGALPDVRQTRYCRPGRTREEQLPAVSAMELLFDHPLRCGETYIAEWTFGYSAGGPAATTYRRWFRLPVQSFLLQVQFAPEAMPIRTYQVWEPNASAPGLDLRELHPDHWHTVHFAQSDVRPGTLGIRWEWE